MHKLAHKLPPKLAQFGAQTLRTHTSLIKRVCALEVCADCAGGHS